MSGPPADGRWARGSRVRLLEASPDPALPSWIRGYQLLASNPAAGAAAGSEAEGLEGLLVPDGHLEVGFNLGADRFDRLGGTWRRRPRWCVDEVLDHACRVRWSGPIRYVAVKFRHAAALDLMGLSTGDVARHPVELASLADPELRTLPERLGSAADWPGMVSVLDTAFLRRARRLDSDSSGGGGGPDAMVARASASIRASGGAATVGSVARSLGVSRRTLELRVKERTGLTPKRLAQAVRTREAIRRVSAGPGRPLGRLALELGFCDQSHFIREFRGTVGCSPTEFFAAPQFVAEMISHSSNRDAPAGDSLSGDV